MNVQVLTFRAEGFSESELARQSDIIGLAVRDFPGAVSSHCVREARGRIFGSVIVWEDAFSLARFRHSELYARLMLHPYLSDPSDQEISVEAHADPAALLLAA